MHFSHLRIAQLVNHSYKNSFVLFGRFVTMPYKISFTNITNLSYVGKSFHGEISRGGREIFHGGELDFPKLLKKLSAIK